MRGRAYVDVGQRLRGVALDLGNGADRISRRKAAAESRSDQQVARDHVGARGQVGKLEPARVAGAHCNGTQAVAVDLDGYRMRSVTDENHLTGELLDAGDLTEYAARIEYRLADEYSVARALVHQDPLTKGVEIHVHDVADDEPARHAGRAVAQRTQSLSFGLQRLVALELELSQPQLRLEFGFVRAQRVAGRDAFSKPIPALERARHRDLHGIRDNRQQAPNLTQMVVALIDDDQSEGQQGIQHTAEQQPRRSPGRVGITKCDHGQGLA